MDWSRVFVLLMLSTLMCAYYYILYHEYDNDEDEDEDEDDLNHVCTSNDIHKYLQHGNKEFAHVFKSCGIESLGNAQKMQVCIREKYPDFTIDCAKCFGRFESCVAKNCKRICLFKGKDSDECKDCAELHCGSNLARCTGVPDDNRK
jgi:hypothetical protein